MLLLRLPMTSVDNEELALISAYDAAVAGELSAHIVALQALASEASLPPPRLSRRSASPRVQGGAEGGGSGPAAAPAPAAGRQRRAPPRTSVWPSSPS
jgi:hypothetical protein